MTGGGFGGCVLALVDTQEADRVSETVAKAFATRDFRPPTSFVAVPSDGAQRLG
jgi:galactokinase